MSFGHERLDVYWPAIEYVGWVHRFCQGRRGIVTPAVLDRIVAMLTRLGQRG